VGPTRPGGGGAIVLATVSLLLLATFGGLISWAAVVFDDTATEGARQRQTVILNMPSTSGETLHAEPTPTTGSGEITGRAEPGVSADNTEDLPAPPPSALEPSTEMAVDTGAPEVHEPAGSPAEDIAAEDIMAVDTGAPEVHEPAGSPAEDIAAEDIAAEDIAALALTESSAPTEPGAVSAPLRGVPRTMEEFRGVIVPDPELTVASPSGPLPVIGPDGREPWRIYARYHEDTGDRPRIAIVLGRLGYSQSATHASIQQLPGAITLGFAPYAPRLADWISQARAAGHEVLLQIPMEPYNYPANDPGPYTLLTSLSTEDNIGRLEWLLGRGSGYVGITNFMGSRFTSSRDHVKPILGELKERGLLFLDAKVSRDSVAQELATELGVPNTASSRFLDLEASRVAIDARLFELERIAKSAGSAVGMGLPYPVTIERLAVWAETLEAKGLALVPVSALAMANGHQ